MAVCFPRWLFLIGLLFLWICTRPCDAGPFVPSFERFYRNQPDQLIPAGELMINELHCVNCHPAPESLSSRFPFRMGPDLALIVSRVRPAYLLEHLLTPHGRCAGSGMPNLVSDQKTARALAAFIWQSATRETPSPPLSRGDSLKGKNLYQTVGCLACHPVDPFSKQAEDSNSGLSLAFLSHKYTLGGLADFLLNPALGRQTDRMGVMISNPEEALDLARFLIEADPSASVTDPPVLFSKAHVDLGSELFYQLRCVACHQPPLTTSKAWNSPSIKSIDRLDAEGVGCLSQDKMQGIPFFRLDEYQRAALVEVLSRVSCLPDLSTEDRIHASMLVRNCYQCHERNHFGGVLEPKSRWFTSNESDLGAEGCLPPDLTHVGRKLRPEALIRSLTGEGSVRPYMNTRMPGYQPQFAQRLTSWLVEADSDPNERPTPREGHENLVGRNMWGRELMGQTGLNCIACHRLKGRPSLGIQAMDLQHAPERLRPEWFRDYLLDPSRFRSGTRMPAFWPDGKPSLKGFGGTSDRQIDSLWVYLNELDQSRLPAGMEDGEIFVLVPETRPIVFRTFMRDAGAHSIALGFPEKIHLAFDAQTCRWMYAWTGDFLSVESTWQDRFAPPTEPLGEPIFLMDPTIRSLASPDYRFLGYRLEENGLPIMRYRIGSSVIEDGIEPHALKDRRGFVRRLAIQGTATWLDVFLGESPVMSDDSVFTFSNGLHIRTESQTRFFTDEAGSPRFQVKALPTSGDELNQVLYDW